MPLSLKWDEVPQAASSGDFLVMWWSEHTHPHSGINTIAYLMGFDGVIFCFSQADKHELPVIVSSWLFDLWCKWVMNKFIRQLRINCPDLPVSHSLFQISRFVWLIYRRFLYSIVTRLRTAGRQYLTEKKNEACNCKTVYLVATIWQTGVSSALNCFTVRQFHL